MATRFLAAVPSTAALLMVCSAAALPTSTGPNGTAANHTITLLTPSRELLVELVSTVAADGSLSETVNMMERGKPTTLATYGGPRVALTGTTGEQIPGVVHWAPRLTMGGTADAPSLSATGTLVIKGRPAVPGSNATVHTHTDFSGGDYKHFILPAATTPASACQAACEKEAHGTPRCVGWTWACPGMQGAKPVCWLKEQINLPPKTDCATSGTVGIGQPAVPDAVLNITRTVTLVPATNSASGCMVHVSHSLRCTAGASCSFISFEDVYEAVLGKDSTAGNGWAGELPDFVWSQSIKEGPQDIVSHWNFKSPGLIVQEGTLLAALVADLGAPGKVAKGEMKEHPQLLDLHNPTDLGSRANPTMSYGLASSAYRVHSIYSRTPTVPVTIESDATVTLDYLLFLDTAAKDADQGGDTDAIATLMWERMGRAALLDTPHAQRNFKNGSLALFDTWQEHAWHETAQSVYFEFDCAGGKELGLKCSSLAAKRVQFSQHADTTKDMWMNAWFQDLRQALGMYQYGMSTNNTRLQQQALGSVALALEAPQKEGAFPSIFWLADDGSQNWADDSGWAGLCREEGSGSPPANCTGFFHLYDNVWSSYWMLQWMKEQHIPPELVTRIKAFVGRVADFAVSVQQKDSLPVRHNNVNGVNGGGDLKGGMPAWFDPSTLAPRPEMRFNSETAAVAFFLAEAHGVGLKPASGTMSYLAVAEAAMNFVEREIVPSGRWFDFETFVSCSLKSFDLFDNRTNQHPANNLAMIQAGFAELRLFELTGNVSRLESGQRILGRLSLTQAVWSHADLTPVLSGGFTTQNTDTEWSDSRQHLCAVLYLQYYFAVSPRRPEYLERAVAALRSSFAIAPYENWAHTGGGHNGDIPGALSSAVHWGEGSAAASVLFTREQLGDLYVYSGKNAHGVCVNGCTMTNLTVKDGSSVSFHVVSPFTWTGDFVVVVDGATTALEVVLNGKSCGTFGVAELKSGVRLPAKLLAHDMA